MIIRYKYNVEKDIIHTIHEGETSDAMLPRRGDSIEFKDEPLTYRVDNITWEVDDACRSVAVNIVLV